MKIIKAKDYNDMSRKAANIISAQVIMKPNAVLGLATGGTPVGTYKQLIEWYNKGDIDFSEVTTVNLDEYRGLPKTHEQSYWYFMHQHFFNHVNVPENRIYVPDGANPDAAACAWRKGAGCSAVLRRGIHVVRVGGMRRVSFRGICICFTGIRAFWKTSLTA